MSKGRLVGSLTETSKLAGRLTRRWNRRSLALALLSAKSLCRAVVVKERAAEVPTGRERAAFYLGVAAFIVAVGAHIFIWSGGLLALPLAWLLAVGAIVVVASNRRRDARSPRSRWGLGFAVVVLGSSAIEFAVQLIRRATG